MDVLGNFNRNATLHSSSTSEVFSATYGADSLPVAVKRTKITCPNDIARFDKELQLLQACAHDLVVPLLAVIRSPPTYAVVLPHHPRGALFGVLHNSGKTLTPCAAVRLLADVSAALAHLHACAVLHRDVKSDNVLVSNEGRAVLTDFNAAEFADQITGDIMVQARPTGASTVTTYPH